MRLTIDMLNIRERDARVACNIVTASDTFRC